ncbi:MAG TPA: DUF3795 domain-containing protein [Anaerolineae bacterium]|nr:DUF3795 domain-containing protein [Anaerolineae bacterium]
MTGEIAACGLDCGGCDIRLLPLDPDAAARVVAWFHEMKWLPEGEGVDEAIARGMYCRGCHGDRTVHWSADCAILICCVDERGLELCSECKEFPCALLTDRAETNAQYARGLQRLQALR